ncbi:MAG TPA: helix-turn-helix transcriptional regulator [Phycisphaerales bacterium]|nr:helix-turn-helix transcriptional regulator [Phycisphaerales bacterium]
MPKSVFSNEYAIFLRHLREARKRAGLTQGDMARKLRVPQSRVSKCELGERRVDVVELWRWCRILGIPLSDFTRALERDFAKSK